MIGIGLRKEIARDLHRLEIQPDFLELAPENWMGIGGYWGKTLKEISETRKLTAHGLSLSIGSTDPINWRFLKEIKSFLDEYNIDTYSEHLAFSTYDNAHLYELLPIPFTEDAIKHVSNRIRQVQDFLERRLIIENITYYTVLDSQLGEVDFLNAILKEANCELLLDVNNIYINSKNHNYDPKEFLEGIDTSRVTYVHVGGHQTLDSGIILDTHDNVVIDPVFELLTDLVTRINPSTPILLERDGNFERFVELNTDMKRMKEIINSVFVQ